MTKSGNIAWHEPLVTRHARQGLNGHRSVVVWLAGLSGSPESQPSPMLLREDFTRSDAASFVLDGDNVRDRLYGDLGFSEEERDQIFVASAATPVREKFTIAPAFLPSMNSRIDRNWSSTPGDCLWTRVSIRYLQGRGVLTPS